MSHADNAVVTLAVRMKAALPLADERIIRRIAGVEGVRTVGTLGLLLQALRKGLLPGTEGPVMSFDRIADGSRTLDARPVEPRQIWRFCLVPRYDLSTPAPLLPANQGHNLPRGVALASFRTSARNP